MAGSNHAHWEPPQRKPPQRKPVQSRPQYRSPRPQPSRPTQSRPAQPRQSTAIPAPRPQQRRRPRRRPISREEAQRRQELRLRMQQMEEESRELAKGPIDLPFALLVVLLTAIGLVMLLSASFPSAYYESGNPAHYFIRQAIFAVIGISAMLMVGKINYQRFRGAAKFLLYLSIFLLVLVIIPGNPFAHTSPPKLPS